MTPKEETKILFDDIAKEIHPWFSDTNTEVVSMLEKKDMEPEIIVKGTKATALFLEQGYFFVNRIFFHMKGYVGQEMPTNISDQKKHEKTIKNRVENGQEIVILSDQATIIDRNKTTEWCFVEDEKRRLQQKEQEKKSNKRNELVVQQLKKFSISLCDKLLVRVPIGISYFSFTNTQDNKKFKVILERLIEKQETGWLIHSKVKTELLDVDNQEKTLNFTKKGGAFVDSTQGDGSFLSLSTFSTNLCSTCL